MGVEWWGGESGVQGRSCGFGREGRYQNSKGFRNPAHLIEIYNSHKTYIGTF